jgi:selenocysteine lyase/cysteine desulfurase
MSIRRRSFLVAAATAAAIDPASVLDAQSKPNQGRDPLGVRDDFPIVSGHIFLNSAYIAPTPKAVVAASRAYLDGQSARPMQLGVLMATNDDVRARFARIVNAAPDEIGLLYSTGEGESVIANGIGLS